MASDLREAGAWERIGDNLIECGIYSIQRAKTSARTLYFLWKLVPANGRRYHALIDRYEDAQRAREAAHEDSLGRVA